MRSTCARTHPLHLETLFRKALGEGVRSQIAYEVGVPLRLQLMDLGLQRPQRCQHRAAVRRRRQWLTGVGPTPPPPSSLDPCALFRKNELLPPWQQSGSPVRRTPPPQPSVKWLAHRCPEKSSHPPFEGERNRTTARALPRFWSPTLCLLPKVLNQSFLNQWFTLHLSSQLQTG